MIFKTGDKVIRTGISVNNNSGHFMKMGDVHIVKSHINNILLLEGVTGSWLPENFALCGDQQKSNKHVHADLIVLWANGADIEVLDKRTDNWKVVTNPSWSPKSTFRLAVVKPKFETHRRRVVFNMSQQPGHSYLTWYPDGEPNVEITVETATGKVVKINQI